MTGTPKRTLQYFIAVGIALAVGLTLGSFMGEDEKIDPVERQMIHGMYALPPKTDDESLRATNHLVAQLRSFTSVAEVRREPHNIPAFALLDHDGQPFTRENLNGGWHLMFTGFSHCPDICPPTLNVMEQVDDALKAAGAKQPQLLFVSVDPARDTPAALKRYLSSRNVRGLTGPEAQLKQLVLKGLFMPYATEVKENENYNVSHNGSIALINPAGQFVAFFPQHPRPLNVQLIARDLQRLMSP